MVYGLFHGFTRRSRERAGIKPLVLLAGFMLAYTVIHLLTWALIRYRLPVDATLLLFAGLGAQEITTRWWKS
jgi:hydrogenase/urease accessory protein HupE